MSLHLSVGQRVIVHGDGPLIDRIAIVDFGPEPASHRRDPDSHQVMVYRVIYERTGLSRWVLSSRLQGYGRGSRSIVSWSDCLWQPKPEVVAFIERSGLGQRLMQLRGALAAWRKEGGHEC